MTGKSLIKFIDDDLEDLKIYKRKLEIDGSLMVELVDPRKFPSVSDYDKILFDETKAIIIDQRIAEFSGVPYDGLEIAEFLRSLNPMIPIFVLTNYEEETDESALGWSVEYVIPKRKFKTEKEVQIHIKRILRAIRRYEDALSEKTRIFERLIDKKVSGNISGQEEKELREIRSGFERIFSIREAKELEKIEEIEKDREVLNRILAELKRLSKRSK